MFTPMVLRYIEAKKRINVLYRVGYIAIEFNTLPTCCRNCTTGESVRLRFSLRAFDDISETESEHKFFLCILRKVYFINIPITTFFKLDIQKQQPPTDFE